MRWSARPVAVHGPCSRKSKSRAGHGPALNADVRAPGTMLRRVLLTSLLAMAACSQTDVPQHDDMLTISDNTLSSLRAFRDEAKFREDMTVYYPGASDEISRVRLEGQMNQLLDRLIANLPANPSRSYVLEQFREALPTFDLDDSEDRDQVARYLERVMDIVGIVDSGGLLNEWRYGFQPPSAP